MNVKHTKTGATITLTDYELALLKGEVIFGYMSHVPTHRQSSKGLNLATTLHLQLDARPQDLAPAGDGA